MPKHFSKKLLLWYNNNVRELPWKQDRDPYKTWISEIILQQTRVAQGTPYYLKFIEIFPDIHSLAKAKEDQVLKLWEGLGYYSRARNLHFTAKYICNELDGKFPEHYEDILSLKGIGPYTAAAIASFSYGLSYPVVDGNVLRLVSRYFGIEESIDKGPTKKLILELMQRAIQNTDPAIFNQAIMDKGALICTPKNPKCEQCSLSDSCYALAKNKISALPKRTKKIKKTKKYFFYFFLKSKGMTYIRRRDIKGIWQGLYEFPVLERSVEDFDKIKVTEQVQVKTETIKVSKTYKHLLTHQILFIKFIEVEGKPKTKDFLSVPLEKLHEYAFPRVINLFLEEWKM